MLEFNTVCCYNNRDILEKYLLKSLKIQTMDNRLILIDNRNNAYKSAAKALNYGGNQTDSEYIIFIHQDVNLVSPNWLKIAYNTMKKLPKLGIAGPIGIDEKHAPYGNFADGGTNHCDIYNKKDCPHKVMTLDSCLAIIPQKVFQKIKFDEKTFTSWHAYIEDYCLECHINGLNVYAIDNYIEHNKDNLNPITVRGDKFWQDMQREGRKLINKWEKKLGKPVEFTWREWVTGK